MIRQLHHGQRGQPEVDEGSLRLDPVEAGALKHRRERGPNQVEQDPLALPRRRRGQHRGRGLRFAGVFAIAVASRLTTFAGWAVMILRSSRYSTR